MSDPAGALCHAAPSRPAGSLTPHVGVGDALGRACCAHRNAVRESHERERQFPSGRTARTALLLPRSGALRRTFQERSRLGEGRGGFAVAPVPDFP